MRVERQGPVAIWTLARPQAHNALDAATFDALHQAVARASVDPTLRAVILTGEGRSFAAGGDLRELRRATSAGDARRLAEVGRGVCDGLAALPFPVIAALNGAAIGGGAELAMACDLRVADPAATLCFKHARMGVTTAWGILPRLVAIAGHAAASRLLLTACTVGADEALALGLVGAVSSPAGSLTLALDWAAQVARGAPGAVAGLKALLGAAAADLAVRELEHARFVESWTSPDHEDAVEAFFEGRPPRWTAGG